MNSQVVTEVPTRPLIDRGRVAVGITLLFAALAPVMPSTVLTRGYIPAGIVLLLHWRRLDITDCLAIGLAAWATASAVGNLGVAACWLATANYWSVCLIFIAVRTAVADRQDLFLAAAAYLAGCVWVAVDIIEQSLDQGVSLRLDPNAEVIRLGIEGVNSNFTAYCLATGVAVALVVLKSGAAPRWLRLLVLAAIPVLAYATVGTGTRGAQIAIVLALIYVLANRVAPRPAWRVVAAGVPVMLVLVASGVYGDRRLLWIQDYFGRASTDLSGRTNLWPIARDVWSEHFWTGVGPGMFPLSNSFNIGAHNLMLSVGAELGLIGLALFSTVVVRAVTGPARRPATRPLIGILLITCLPIWLSGMWELSPAGWFALALWSRADQLAASDPDRDLRSEADTEPSGPRAG